MGLIGTLKSRVTTFSKFRKQDTCLLPFPSPSPTAHSRACEGRGRMWAACCRTQGSLPCCPPLGAPCQPHHYGEVPPSHTAATRGTTSHHCHCHCCHHCFCWVGRRCFTMVVQPVHGSQGQDSRTGNPRPASVHAPYVNLGGACTPPCSPPQQCIEQ